MEFAHKLKSLFMLVALIMAMAITNSATYSANSEESTSMTHGRFLISHDNDRYGRGAAAMTCNKYPRVCTLKGSPGPDCCKKKCVNVENDRTNCGRCGKKCKYSEICCNGWCVNPSVNKLHCGSCSNMCKNGSACVYGMCNYA